MGPPRHLTLLPDLSAERIAWPVPFADGIEQLLALRGKQVVVLASGDPFWFGAGSILTRHLEAGDWQALPGPSCFSLAAAHMGWPLERTSCLGLHAAPLTRLRPHLAPGARLIVTLRDGEAVAELATYLTQTGFADSEMTVFEALGGPRERVTSLTAAETEGKSFAHPVCVGLCIAGSGPALPRTSGLPDDLFETDGVMTKRPLRALTLSALAPQPGEYLWDIGGGSGSIAIEWLLVDPSCTATTIEPRADRIGLIRANATALGVDWLEIVEGTAPTALDGLPQPDVVFIGGGLSAALLADLRSRLPKGTRLVANAVTLESEALLAQTQAELGGTLMRIELSHAGPMGGKRGWQAAYPIVQWSVTL